ncbi:hypothetical protein MRQ86_00575 [Streptomyces sp. MMS21 TC-5]|uniref:hypothetical protein n=1 Tax=Streptomyces sp. MMS21 TC-5 TaxID=2925833 RepID=UPI001F60A86D|nr:hypothetical protein [Streptomyces sp. MMS21 TC-5]MCI4078872.1 hypothetical protein [Streptomyces sp. MMS21 TC-5]
MKDLPESSARSDLIRELLQGTLRDSAPQWILSAAIDSDRSQQPDSYARYTMSLSATALAHPSCPAELRATALRRCSIPELGALSRHQPDEVLAQAIVAELRDRGPHRQPMTPQLLKEPSAAQILLREPQLGDTVFHAALELLPTTPVLEETNTEDSTDSIDAYFAAIEAWDSLWARITTTHTGRHRQLLDWAGNSRAGASIRTHLLGTVPWDVEPALLEEVALHDLADFPRAALITRASRALRDGTPGPDVRTQFASELHSLSPKQRRHVEQYLDEPDLIESALHTAVSWVASRAQKSWRHILNPSDAKNDYGQPQPWRAPEELLATLAERFAQIAGQALELFEPHPRAPRTRPRPQDLRWLHALLLHQPDLLPQVRDQARTMLDHYRPRPRSSWERADFASAQQDRELAELHMALTRLLQDPAAASRCSALGDASQVTPEQLAQASEDVLDDYLSRHAGNDDLIEKTLLSYAVSRTGRSQLSFGDVLARHSHPRAALTQLTTDLRRRLGGAPHQRETWAALVLRIPDCPTEAILALPAWTALTAGGQPHGTASTAVAELVTSALGDDDEAWTRFSASPAAHAGPAAWLRLGDILTAAAHGTPWPKPPRGK